MCEKNTNAATPLGRSPECVGHVEAALADLRMAKRWINGDVKGGHVGEDIHGCREALKLARSRMQLALKALDDAERPFVDGQKEGGGAE